VKVGDIIGGYRLVTNVDAPFEKQFLNVAQRQWKPHVQHHPVNRHSIDWRLYAYVARTTG